MKAIRSAAARRVWFTVGGDADRLIADRVRFSGSLTHPRNDTASLAVLSRLVNAQLGHPVLTTIGRTSAGRCSGR